MIAAKMSLQLARDLFLRYTLPGQVVLDPFLGRGTSLVGCLLGRDVIGVELESAATGGSPFVEYARENWAHLQAHTLPGLPLGQATILQGDSRHLPLPDAAQDDVLSSPPYADTPAAEARHLHFDDRRRAASIRRKQEDGVPHGYGGAVGQIGNLPHTGGVAACVTSPPFGGSEAVDNRGVRGVNDQHGGGNAARDGYQQAGNLAALRHQAGGVAAAVASDGTSAPFAPLVALRLMGASAEELRRSEQEPAVLLHHLRALAARGHRPAVAWVAQEKRRARRARTGHQPLTTPQAEGVADAVVSSPPFGEMNAIHLAGDAEGAYRPFKGGNLYARFVYGATPGNIGNLARGAVSAAIGSPPFADSGPASHDDLYTRGEDPSGQAHNGRFRGGSLVKDTYQAAGNVGKLPAGDVAAAITSPPYQDARGDWPTPEGAGNVRYGSTPGQIGGLAAGDVSAVVSSPPYADGVQARDRLAAIHRAIAEGRASPEFVARFAGLRAGDADQAAHLAAKGYGAAEGQIGRLPVGDVSAVVTSSPYADVASRNRSQEPYCLAQDQLMKARYGTGDTARHIDGYGQSAGQIGALPHDAAVSGVVTSPPYQKAITQGGETGAWAAKYGYQGANGGYSPNQENIGNQAPETYSSAMLAVLTDCYRVVRPGGVLVLVVGNLVRDGKMIDLAADTIALAAAAGWTPWERWRHEKAQISFWRRLHARQAAAKGLDPAAVTVTHEDVLVFVKGEAPAWEFQDLPPTTRAPVSVAALSAPALPPAPAPSMAPLFTLAGEPDPREAATHA